MPMPMSTRTASDMIREYKHALAQDFTKDGEPAAYAPGQPQKWSQASIALKPEGCAPDEVTAFAISLSCARVAVAVRNEVRVYDAASLVLQCVLKGLVGKINPIQWHPSNENILITASSYRAGGPGMPKTDVPSSLVRIWDLDDVVAHETPMDESAKDAAQAALSRLPILDAATSDVTPAEELSKLTQMFAVALQERVVCRDVRAGRYIEASLPSFGSSAFNHSGASLFCINRSTNSVIVYNIDAHAVHTELRGHTDSIMWVGATPDDQVIGTSCWDRTVRLWDARTGVHLRMLRGGTKQSWGAAFSLDGSLIAAGNGDRKLRVWDVATGELVHTLDGFGGWVRAVAFCPGPTPGAAPLIVAGCGGGHRTAGSLRLFDASSGTCVSTWQVDSKDLTPITEILRVVCSRDGKIALKGPDRRLVVYDTVANVKWEFFQDEEQRRAVDTSNSSWRDFTFTGDGRTVWSCDHDGVVRRWDLYDSSSTGIAENGNKARM
jgi:WD40 repeat protein